MHRSLRGFVVCGIALLIGCGGGSITVPPTPTSLPPTPTATPVSTATALPTATIAPTVTPVPTATPLPPAATPTSAPVSRAPLGSAPPGWKTYTGNPRMPFAVYYPPDWTVDESDLAAKGQVKFFSPTRNPSLWIHVNTERTTTSIDTLRDAQAKGLAQSCVRSGVELTQQGTVSNVVFDELIESCDLADQGQLSVFLFGVGLNHGFAWDITAYSPRMDFNHNTCGCPAGNVEAFFDPMLNSANIYGDPAG
jgi:hypothetical protein